MQIPNQSFDFQNLNYGNNEIIYKEYVNSIDEINQIHINYRVQCLNQMLNVKDAFF